MNSGHLLVNVSDRIMKITLNRPESLNAFSAEMISGLTHTLKDASKDPEVRVIILSGAGRSFSAGGDVKTMGQAEPAEVYEHIGKLNECILAIKETEKPIIAAVHGFAAGAGFNLALACDLILAAEDSKFALSFSQVGLISDGGGSYFLPRLIGTHLAKQFFFSGEAVSAQRMYELGVVNALVPSHKLEEEVVKYASRLANGPGRAFAMMKKLIDHSLSARLEDILEQERITQTLMVATDDHQEGIAAFKEKRKPVFTGQ
ncbi:enoyl-CoA hydratase/isomerase family protein [Peribacillus deserti]|uniref:Enoyl-CoA hydratase n=1 Tax=Peribacillus deserti TaxID=673318 RepID=A0A2N5M1I7_9BACI|nr:enoyl-CoA hydratase [Peribacillus deserti]PLT28220.1 enoyl-CoA hydratase [Peribacillus deserti]